MGPSIRPVAAAPLRGRHPLRLGELDQTVSDIACPMYPSIEAIVAHARSGRQKHPLIMCEFSHAMGNSNGTLAEYWDAIETTPGLQGGYIWEWWDHGLEQQLPDGTTRWAYGGDFGDTPNDGDFCVDGLNWPDRTPKPAMWEAHAIASPVRVALGGAERIHDGILVLENRRWFRDTSWLHARWSLELDGEVQASGELPLPVLAPGATGELRLPDGVVPADAQTGESWLTISFVTAADEPWAAAGHEVGWAQVRLPGVRPAAGTVDTAAAPAGHRARCRGSTSSIRCCPWRRRCPCSGHPPTTTASAAWVSAWEELGLATLERRLVGIERSADGGAIVRAEDVTGLGCRGAPRDHVHAAVGWSASGSRSSRRSPTRSMTCHGSAPSWRSCRAWTTSPGSVPGPTRRIPTGSWPGSDGSSRMWPDRSCPTSGRRRTAATPRSAGWS